MEPNASKKEPFDDEEDAPKPKPKRKAGYVPKPKSEKKKTKEESDEVAPDVPRPPTLRAKKKTKVKVEEEEEDENSPEDDEIEPEKPKRKYKTAMDALMELDAMAERSGKKIRRCGKYVSVYDMISVACECSEAIAPNKLRDIRKKKSGAKTPNLKTHTFPGQGQRETPIADPDDMLTIILALPMSYPIVKELRDTCNKTLIRHLAGEETFIQETINNQTLVRSGQVPEDRLLHSFVEQAATLGNPGISVSSGSSKSSDVSAANADKKLQAALAKLEIGKVKYKFKYLALAEKCFPEDIHIRQLIKEAAETTGVAQQQQQQTAPKKAFFEICEPLAEVIDELKLRPALIVSKRSIIGRMVSKYVTENYPNVVKEKTIKVCNSSERPVMAYPSRIRRRVKHFIKYVLAPKYLGIEAKDLNESEIDEAEGDELDNNGNAPAASQQVVVPSEPRPQLEPDQPFSDAE